MGPCWPHFRSKWGGPVARSPLFCWVYVIFRFFGRPGPLLAPFGLDFGKVWGSIWEVFQDGFGSILKVFQDGFGSILKVFQEGLGSILERFGRFAARLFIWFWMGWWGYAKR